MYLEIFKYHYTIWFDIHRHFLIAAGYTATILDTVFSNLTTTITTLKQDVGRTNSVAKEVKM